MQIIDVPDKLAERIISAIEEFDSISGELKRMNKKLDRASIEASVNTAALIDKIKIETTIDESIKALIEGLVDLDPALAGLTGQLKASMDPLLAAIKANT